MRYYFVSAKFSNEKTDFGLISVCIKVDRFSLTDIKDALNEKLKELGIPKDEGVGILSITPLTKQEFDECKDN